MMRRARLQVEELGQRIMPATATSVSPLFPLFGIGTAQAPAPSQTPVAANSAQSVFPQFATTQAMLQTPIAGRSAQSVFPQFATTQTTLQPPNTNLHILAGQGEGTYTGAGSIFSFTPQSATLNGVAILPQLGRFTVGPPITATGLGIATGTGTGTGTVIGTNVGGTRTTLAQLGQVTVTGTIHGVGARAGVARGTITFTNIDGSITIAVTGPLQASFAALPSLYSYRVVATRGRFAPVRDSGPLGSLALTLVPAPAGTAPPSLFPQAVGTFTMTIAGGTPATPAAQLNSGITGVALVGPTTPVTRPGVPDSAPLAGAVLLIEPAAGGPVVARVVTDARGAFTVRLAPGTYRIIPEAPRAGALFPHPVSDLIVTVSPGTYTSVIVSYDSGIR